MIFLRLDSYYDVTIFVLCKVVVMNISTIVFRNEWVILNSHYKITNSTVTELHSETFFHIYLAVISYFTL